MTRFARTFKPQAMWLGCFAACALLTVYGSIGHGWTTAEAQTLPAAMGACAVAVLGWFFVAMGGVFVLIEGEFSDRRERFRSEGKARIVAEHRGDRVRIMRYGGGSYERELGNFSVLDAERAMDCMAAARADLKPELDAHAEAARLARVLNR